MTLETHHFTIGDTSSKPGLFFPASHSFVIGGLVALVATLVQLGGAKVSSTESLFCSFSKTCKGKGRPNFREFRSPYNHRKKDERRVHLRIDPRKKRGKSENPSEPNKIIFRFRFVKIFGTRFLGFLQKWCWDTPWESTDLTSQTIEEFHAKTCFSSQRISEVCLDSRRNLGAKIWWRCKK